jgi:hypothetical protein
VKRLIPCALALLLAGCGQEDKVAGGNSSEVPNALDGTALDEQGRPLAGAAVRVMAPWAWSDSGKVVDSARTDSLGHWSIAVPEGIWSVLVQSGSSLAVHLASPDGNRRPDTLRPGAWISGTVGGRFARTRVSLVGTPLFAETDSSGSFVLGPLPSGDLTLRLQADSLREDAVVHADPGQVLSTGAWEGAAWGQESATLWPFARTAVVDLSATGARVVGDQVGFVVPVVLDSVLDVGSIDSTGIRFDDGKGKFLPRALSWDAAAGRATAWVRLDTANGNSAKHFLRVLWGRSVRAPSDMPAIFGSDNGFSGAWHLDSASETSGGIGLRWTGSTSTTGSVDGARQLAGSGQWATDSVNLGGTASWTVSLWVRLDAKPSGETLLAGVDGAPDTARWGLSVKDDMTVRLWSGANSGDEIATTTPLAVGTWTRLAATFDAASSRIGLVVDTTIYARTTVKYPAASRSPIHGGSGLRATFDELRLSDTARDVHWSQLEHQTQVRGGVPWIRW